MQQSNVVDEYELKFEKKDLIDESELVVRSNHSNSQCEWVKPNDVYYVTKLATTTEPFVLWHHLRDITNLKMRVLSNECCLNSIGQYIDEISPFSSLRQCLRPSKWRDRRFAGRNSRPIAKLSYLFELPFDAESKLYTHLIVAQPTRALQPDFTSILPSTKLEKLIAPNFRLNKDNMTDESPLANAFDPFWFPPFTRCLNVRDMTEWWMGRMFETTTFLGALSDSER